MQRTKCVSSPVQPAGAPRLFVDNQEGQATDAGGFNRQLKFNGVTYASYTKECGRGGGRTGKCNSSSDYTVGTITTDILPLQSGEIVIEFKNKGITPPGKTSYIQIKNNSNRQVRVRYAGQESLVCPKSTTKFTVGLTTAFNPLKVDNC